MGVSKGLTAKVGRAHASSKGASSGGWHLGGENRDQRGDILRLKPDSNPHHTCASRAYGIVQKGIRSSKSALRAAPLISSTAPGRPSPRGSAFVLARVERE